MLETFESDHGVVIYRSARLAGLAEPLGLRHGFTTRRGGLSRPPYDSLNLGSLAKGKPGELGDANTDVAANFRRAREALGLSRCPRVAVRQEHGAVVYVAGEAIPSPVDPPVADAIITAQRDRMLVIRTADCVPVLLASTDPRRPGIGAVHAGWRGILAGVVSEAVQRMDERLSVAATNLAAVIGPCISVSHFEVGSKLAGAFEQAGLGGCVHRAKGQTSRPRVDLARAVREQLEHAGVPAGSIDDPIDSRSGRPLCTYAMPELFFSHRRDVTHGDADNADTGRMAALIALR